MRGVKEDVVAFCIVILMVGSFVLFMTIGNPSQAQEVVQDEIQVVKETGRHIGNTTQISRGGVPERRGIDKLLEKKADSSLVQLLAENELSLFKYINVECYETGIPASAVIAQMIHETGWDMSNERVSQTGHNLWGTRCDWGHGLTRDGFTVYVSYTECVDAYIRIIKNEYPYCIQAAKVGGPEAYIRALEFPPEDISPSHRWCANDPGGYVRKITSEMKQYQIVDTGNTEG